MSYIVRSVEQLASIDLKIVICYRDMFKYLIIPIASSVSQLDIMDIDQHQDSKKPKVVAGQEIIDMDQLLNQEVEVPITIIQEEIVKQMTKPKQSKEEEEVDKGLVFKVKEYSYATVEEGQFKSKNELLLHYLDQRKQCYAGTQEKMKTLISQSKEKVSLMTVKDSTTGTLNLALTDGNKVSKFCIDMKQLSALDKVWLHKQVSEVLYADLNKEKLDHNKAKIRMAKLEA